MFDTSRFAAVALVVALALSAPAPVQAAAAPRPAVVAAAPAPLAWSFSKFLSGLNSRERIIPFCVVVMALALFILIKKLTP
jgi:hypothetical protein